MNFKDNVGARLDELGLPRRKHLRRLARRVTHEEIARQGAGVNVVAFGLGSHEENSGLLTFKPMRTRLADERDDVVHVRAIVGTRLGELYPLIFCESGWDDDFLIFDGA